MIFGGFLILMTLMLVLGMQSVHSLLFGWPSASNLTSFLWLIYWKNHHRRELCRCQIMAYSSRLSSITVLVFLVTQLIQMKHNQISYKASDLIKLDTHFMFSHMSL